MIIAFRSIFNSQYEGGANWLEVTLRCLGMIDSPPTCLVVGASTEELPEILRTAAHVRAVPLHHKHQSRSSRLAKRVIRKVRNQSWETPELTRIASEYGVDLWSAFAWFDELGSHRPLLICYPDFQFRHFPDLFEPGETQKYEEQWNYIATHASGIVSISQATANDALKSDPQIEPKLHVCGFPPIFDTKDLQKDPEEVRGRFSLPEKFFLICNQFWEHKNHLLVLRALALLKQQGKTPPVVAFTGRPYDSRRPEFLGKVLRFVHEHDLHAYCRFLSVLPRDEQIALIRAAEAVIQPSKFEGRGAITEETCLVGTQLLCSDLPSHREMNLPGAIFFDVEDVENLAELLSRQYPQVSIEPEDIVAESRLRGRDYGERMMEICQRVVASANP
ncbi:MAG TPA: glycosyltransferase [Pyrinomonadaceae bacterium]|nr:glycosyltransferase [Pyrinomonadaceae bacterium]